MIETLILFFTENSLSALLSHEDALKFCLDNSVIEGIDNHLFCFTSMLLIEEANTHDNSLNSSTIVIIDDSYFLITVAIEKTLNEAEFIDIDTNKNNHILNNVKLTILALSQFRKEYKLHFTQEIYNHDDTVRHLNIEFLISPLVIIYIAAGIYQIFTYTEYLTGDSEHVYNSNIKSYKIIPLKYKTTRSDYFEDGLTIEKKNNYYEPYVTIYLPSEINDVCDYFCTFYSNGDRNPYPVTAAPKPPTFWLFVSALIGITCVARRKNKLQH